MSTQLYATIRRSSKYAHQQPRDAKGTAVPFEVELGGYDSYIFRGSDNRYRVADLTLFVRWRDTFVRIGS